jgi:nitroreductase
MLNTFEGMQWSEAMISRRKFIRIVGASGAAGVLLGAGGYWAATRGAMPASAVAPWSGNAAGLADPRLRAAAIAMLAPNPHNIQPWSVRLIGDDRLRLHVDLKRLLPHTDPPGRQILIGQGTFLELFRMAAAENGYRAELTLFPEGSFRDDRLDNRAVADIRMIEDASVKKDTLFRYVFSRRSNKEPYDLGRPIAASDLGRLNDAGFAVATLNSSNELEMVQTLRDLTEAALKLEIETPHTLKESIDLMRIGPAEVAANPDGIDLLGPMMWWGSRVGMVNREDIATPGTQSFQVGLDMARDQAQSAMAHAWLTAPDNSRVSQLRTGIDYLRLNLQATALGLALHPMSQLLQEYPEMTGLQNRAFETLGAGTPGRVQMLVRLGHAAAPGPSPRRPVGDIVAG